MDGCADVGGCLEAPLALMELFSRGKDPKEGFLILAIIGLIAGTVIYFQPEPKPQPPKPGFIESVKDSAKRAYNRRKIEQAEREYWEQQQQRALPEPETKVAPIDSETRWNRAKDWLRNKLNEDYQHRHPDEDQ
jgi:hypothetical protein